MSFQGWRRWWRRLAGRAQPLKPGLPTSFPSERRRAIRFFCHPAAACYSTGAPEPAPWPATVRDLSVSGIGLTLQRRCAPGDLIEVRLRSPNGRTEQARLLLVVHATRQPGDTWAVGGMFYRELSWQELKALRSGPPA